MDEERPKVESPSGGSEPAKAALPPSGWYPDPNGAAGHERFWDGSQWTDQSRPVEAVTPGSGPTVSTARRSADERKVLLSQQIQHFAARGMRVESQSEFQAILVEGQKVNHTLHAILTIFTCLVWGIVWAIIAGTGGEKRHLVVVDEFGNVQHQKLGKA